MILDQSHCGTGHGKVRSLHGRLTCVCSSRMRACGSSAKASPDASPKQIGIKHVHSIHEGSKRDVHPVWLQIWCKPSANQQPGLSNKKQAVRER